MILIIRLIGRRIPVPFRVGEKKRQRPINFVTIDKSLSDDDEDDDYHYRKYHSSSKVIDGIASIPRQELDSQNNGPFSQPPQPQISNTSAIHNDGESNLPVIRQESSSNTIRIPTNVKIRVDPEVWKQLFGCDMPISLQQFLITLLASCHLLVAQCLVLLQWVIARLLVLLTQPHQLMQPIKTTLIQWQHLLVLVLLLLVFLQHLL